MIKCLIWDLDDTLWQGTLTENGHVELRPGIRETLLELDKRGVMQSICSRNEPERVNQKLIELRIDHYFLYPQFSKGSKVSCIQKIAKELNIGLDTVGFIDDNPYERYEVSLYVPEVYVYDADAAVRLPSLPEFHGSVSRTGAERRQLMMMRMERQLAEKRFSGSREEFLRSCEMELRLRSAKAEDVIRLVELASRTTQFNNLVQAPNLTEIQLYLQAERSQLYVAQLKDRFGNHGIVAMAMVLVHDVTAEIELFCISCRMEGRGIGTVFMEGILSRMYQDWPSLQRVMCRYRPNKRNRPTLLLLQSLGFNRILQTEEEWIFMLPLPYEYKGLSWIHLKMEGASIN
ncbi:HAD-IIIC family phosphatase [Paenibacillus fonticola]|uniref:HAD-IIIC family phosphatase n=1 Tax=Paenibacillus fonticola TaxID=379896 RepID=UPI00036C2AAC|nr:HAD-IIIC family phosphatase [Paenibacillus fonticola]